MKKQLSIFFVSSFNFIARILRKTLFREAFISVMITMSLLHFFTDGMLLAHSQGSNYRGLLLST